jgi:hypothetical protein
MAYAARIIAMLRRIGRSVIYATFYEDAWIGWAIIGGADAIRNLACSL